MRAVLFDLDDTLLDYTGGVTELWAATCRDAAGPAGLDGEALATGSPTTSTPSRSRARSASASPRRPSSSVRSMSSASPLATPS